MTNSSQQWCYPPFSKTLTTSFFAFSFLPSFAFFSEPIVFLSFIWFARVDTRLVFQCLLWSCWFAKIKRLLQRLRHECCLRGLVNLLLNLYLIILIVLIRELVFFFLYCDFAYLSESSQNVLPVFVYMKLSMLLCLSRCHYLVTTDIFL